MRGLRVRGVVVTALATAATASAGLGIAQASNPMGPGTVLQPGETYDTALGPVYVFAPVPLSQDLRAPNGETFRLTGGKCADDRIENVMVTPWGGDMRVDMCSPHVNTQTGHALSFGMVGGSDWGVAGFGVTAASIDYVDILSSQRGWVRVPTRPVPADSVEAGGFPTGLRYYFHGDPWDPATTYTSPAPYQGAVAVKNGKIAGCSRELSCRRGARAKRAGKYGRPVTVKSR